MGVQPIEPFLHLVATGDVAILGPTTTASRSARKWRVSTIAGIGAEEDWHGVFQRWCVVYRESLGGHGLDRTAERDVRITGSGDVQGVAAHENVFHTHDRRNRDLLSGTRHPARKGDRPNPSASPPTTTRAPT